MPKSFLKISALITFVICVLYACALVPFNEYLYCDVTLASSLLVDITDVLMQWLEFASATMMIAFCTLAVYHADSLQEAKPIFIWQGAALLFKYVASIISFSILHGSFIDFTLNFWSYFGSLAIEAAIVATAVFLAYRFTSKSREQARQRQNAAMRLGIAEEPAPALLPFKGLFSKGNPLQNAIRLGLGIFCAVRLLAFVLGEVAFSIVGYMFELSDLPITLFYVFLLILLPGFLAYMLLHLTLNKFNCRFFKES